MSAVPQWFDDALEDEETAPAPRPLSLAHDSSRHASEGNGDQAGHQSGQSWNVLAEELVAFPRAAHRLLLADVEPGVDTEPPVRRSYGELWLDQELARIDRQRRPAAGSMAQDLPADSSAGSRRSRPGAAPGRARPDARREQIVSPDFHAWVDSLDTDFADLTDAPGVRTPRPDQSRALRAARAARLVDGRAGTHEVRAPVPHGRGSVRPAIAAAGATAPSGHALRGLRRILPSAAALAALCGILAGAGALASVGHEPLKTIPGATQTPTGLVYVVRPGDTVWGIASRVDPNGDPQPVVAQLESQLHGSPLVPGEKLRLP